MNLKQQLYLTIAILGTVINVNAQLPGNIDYNIWTPNVHDTFYVFGKIANVRAEPKLTATIQDSLYCGDMFIITANEKQFDQVKGIHAPWVKGAYLVNGAKREGYMWVGLLSLGYYVKDSVRFLYGIERITNATATDLHLPATWFIKVKAITEKGKSIDEKEWKMDGPEIAATV